MNKKEREEAKAYKSYSALRDRVIDREKLRGWLSESKAAGDTHLFVIVRTVGEDYYIGIPKGEDPRQRYKGFYDFVKGHEYAHHHILAVYNHSFDHEFQMTMKRPMLWDTEMKVGTTLDRDQHERWLRWVEEVTTRAVAKQKKSRTRDSLWMDGDTPYYGAIGGGFTWTIIYTSIGTIVKCEEAITGEEIDLTDM